MGNRGFMTALRSYDLSAMDGVRLWLPLVLGALGFGCLVWLVSVILRLTRIRRSGPGD